MPRKKKSEEKLPVYVRTHIYDSLSLVSIRTGVEMKKLRELNPHIKGIFFPLLPGEKVRIE